MIPTIGLIIATYCLFRLIQLPLEMASMEFTSFLGMKGKERVFLICFLALPAFLFITMCSVDLIKGSLNTAEELRTAQQQMRDIFK